ncbi:hypothetical protein BKA56DRAFT_667207 [Ilyonectria sp. MPI-CAGE-AT-0026]|nr:hypothetical protein BKA56DRAFT_667207 [Ilyonectria sp. MPI-CAGE-AT-0026]
MDGVSEKLQLDTLSGVHATSDVLQEAAQLVDLLEEVIPNGIQREPLREIAHINPGPGAFALQKARVLGGHSHRTAARVIAEQEIDSARDILDFAPGSHRAKKKTPSHEITAIREELGLDPNDHETRTRLHKARADESTIAGCQNTRAQHGTIELSQQQ